MDHHPDECPQQGIAEGIAMEFYSYVNIFETKGLAYLLLMSFLVLGILLIRYLSTPEKKDSTTTDRKSGH
jgi:hypothetical protein